MARLNDPPGVDLARLRDRLAGPLDCSPAALCVEMIDGGRSNLTYRLTDGHRSWVLRRPPLGHVLATAHDMSREYRIMAALEPVGVPVPRTVLFEDDPAIIGAPFLVMDFVDGVVVRSDADALLLAESDAARAADDLVDQLAILHGIDPARAGLDGFGRPEGFLQRQLERWRRQWRDSGGDPDQPLETLAERLVARLPEQSRAALVHGDYRLDNTILSAADHGRVAAIVDWEMATVGDPLADVGLLLTYWSPLSARVTGAGHPVTANPGFPGGDHVIARYREQSPYPVGDLTWYVAFGHFKLAVIAQTIHARYLQGLTVGPQFESAGQAIPDLVEHAMRLLSS